MFRLCEFLAYQCQSDAARTRFLVDTVRRDPFYAQIMDDLSAFGFHIAYPWFGRNGHYAPHILDVENEKFQDDFDHNLRLGNMRACFSFSPRFGRDRNVHAFLHELTHFYQDMYGLFLEPLSVAGQHVVVPDQESFVAAYIFCEAMAQVEALRAAWRLKLVGSSHAWRGALGSQWSSLARIYEEKIHIFTEQEGAIIAYEHWHKMKQKSYYAARAKRHYNQMIAHISLSLIHISEPTRPY